MFYNIKYLNIPPCYCRSADNVNNENDDDYYNNNNDDGLKLCPRPHILVHSDPQCSQIICTRRLNNKMKQPRKETA